MGLKLPVNGFFQLTFNDEEFKLGALKFIDEKLKPLVPKQCRSYDPKRKLWIIDDKFYGVVRQLYREWFVPPNHDLFGDDA